MKRMWFYRPEWYTGWSMLVPISRGHDEFSRWTLVLGFPWTGRVVIALNDCGDEACHYWQARYELDVQSHGRIAREELTAALCAGGYHFRGEADTCEDCGLTLPPLAFRPFGEASTIETLPVRYGD